MKRFLAVLTSALLVASLTLPATALAAKGGNATGAGRDHAPGQQRKSPAEQIEVTPDPGSAMTNEEDTTGSGNGQAKGRPDMAGAHASENGSDTVMARDRVHVRESQDGSGTTKPTRTGIAQAFDRISANLARADARVASGDAVALPPGLVRVFEKFLGWLGLAPDTTPTDEPATGQETEEPAGSDEATVAPAP